jgi:hypothetical protein
MVHRDEEDQKRRGGFVAVKNGVDCFVFGMWDFGLW